MVQLICLKQAQLTLHTVDTLSYFYNRPLREGRAEQSTTSTQSQEDKVWDPGQPPDLITCRTEVQVIINFIFLPFCFLICNRIIKSLCPKKLENGIW